MLRCSLAALAALVIVGASLVPDDALARRGGGGGFRGGGGGFHGGAECVPLTFGAARYMPGASRADATAPQDVLDPCIR